MQQQAIPAFAIFDDYRPTVAIAAAIRWLLLSAFLAMVNYREEFTSTWIVFNAVGVCLVLANGYMTWRLLAHRPITWHYALGMSLLDLVVITVALYASNGLQNRFYVFYYPALLGFPSCFRGWPHSAY